MFTYLSFCIFITIEELIYDQCNICYLSSRRHSKGIEPHNHQFCNDQSICKVKVSDFIVRLQISYIKPKKINQEVLHIAKNVVKESSRRRKKRTNGNDRRRIRRKRVGESRERNWYSRLSGNVRWFVRQSSFSGLTPRSFSRQLQGEKEDDAKGAPPARRSSSSRPLSSFLFPFSRLRPEGRHMDAHEGRLLRCTRKRSLSIRRLRGSLKPR